MQDVFDEYEDNKSDLDYMNQVYDSLTLQNYYNNFQFNVIFAESDNNTDDFVYLSSSFMNGIICTESLQNLLSNKSDAAINNTTYCVPSNETIRKINDLNNDENFIKILNKEDSSLSSKFYQCIHKTTDRKILTLKDVMQNYDDVEKLLNKFEKQYPYEYQSIIKWNIKRLDYRIIPASSLFYTDTAILICVLNVLYKT